MRERRGMALRVLGGLGHRAIVSKQSSTRVLCCCFVTVLVLQGCVNNSKGSHSDTRARGSSPAVSASVGTGRGESALSRSIHVWRHLEHRSLHIPEIKRGHHCPKTPGIRGQLLTQGALCCFALGEGPVWPDLASPPVYDPATNVGPHSAVRYARQPHTPWVAIKTAWIGLDGFRGRVLVRGRQLDGPRPVRFGAGTHEHHKELRLSASAATRIASGLHHWTSGTRLLGPGCYGFQLDAMNFSRVIVFEARPRGPLMR